MKTVFESDNIRFVEISESLLKDYLTMMNDTENVGKYIGRTDAVSEEKELRWVRGKLEKKACIFSMIEKKSGEFIGNIELMKITNSSGELGIIITGGKQNLGYGTEAVLTFTKYAMKALGLDRVFLRVYPDNERAIHVYKKCGFYEYDRTGDDVFMETTREI